MKFLSGLTIGVVLGFLFAPAAGEQTRHALAEKMQNAAAESEQKLQAKAGDLGSKVGRQAAEAAVAAATKDLLPGSSQRQASNR